jgi:hypothetical protein
MIPRPEPFEGRWGLYEPADTLIFFVPDTRLVVEESVIDFENYDEIYAFLYQGSAVEDWVYTPDGLVVGFGRSPERFQINVDLYQILIHGKRPIALRGARPSNIRFSGQAKSAVWQYAPLQGWQSIGHRIPSAVSQRTSTNAAAVVSK